MNWRQRRGCCYTLSTAWWVRRGWASTATARGNGHSNGTRHLADNEGSGRGIPTEERHGAGVMAPTSGIRWSCGHNTPVGMTGRTLYVQLRKADLPTGRSPAQLYADLVPQWRGRYMRIGRGIISGWVRYCRGPLGAVLSADPLGHASGMSLDRWRRPAVENLDPDGRNSGAVRSSDSPSNEVHS